MAKSEERALLLPLLFKPWREPLDLKNDDQGWEEALSDFQLHCGTLIIFGCH